MPIESLVQTMRRRTFSLSDTVPAMRAPKVLQQVSEKKVIWCSSFDGHDKASEREGEGDSALFLGYAMVGTYGSLFLSRCCPGNPGVT